MNICNCEKCNNNIEKLDAMIVSAWVHGINYDGESFEFCPWCGKKMFENMKEIINSVRNNIIDDFR